MASYLVMITMGVNLPIVTFSLKNLKILNSGSV